MPCLKKYGDPSLDYAFRAQVRAEFVTELFGDAEPPRVLRGAKGALDTGGPIDEAAIDGVEDAVQAVTQGLGGLLHNVFQNIPGAQVVCVLIDGIIEALGDLVHKHIPALEQVVQRQLMFSVSRER